MNYRTNKFLAILLTFLLLFCTAATAAGNGQPTDSDTELFPDYTNADFTGTYGPDNLDSISPNAIPMAASSSTSFTQINNIVIFINFPGAAEFTTTSRIQSAQQVYNLRSDSLKNYVSAHTYGEITVNTSFYPKSTDGSGYVSYVAPQPMDYYKPKTETNTIGYNGYGERYNRERELITGAFNFVKAQVEADFTGAQLDNNEDSYIDSVAFLANGLSGYYGGIGWNDLLWPHKTSYSGLYFNGKQINNYNLLLSEIPPPGISLPEGGIMPEDSSKAESNVIVHEFLHTLGLPDLYHYETGGTPVGEWDIMGSSYSPPPNMLQYMQREYMGWGKPIHELSASGTYTLKAAQYVNPDADGGYNGNTECAYIIRSPYNDSEFIVIEYRRKTGFDSAIPGTGLIVYRVNSSCNGNSSGPPDQVYVYRPWETGPTNSAGDTAYSYFSSQSGRTSFGKPLGQESAGFDNGTIFFSNGANSGIVISSIGWADYSITFTVTLPPALAGTGTQADPYQIYSAAQLQYMNTYPDKSFILKADITLPYTYTYSPITTFSGTFNGNGHTIQGLIVGETGNRDAGMFRRLEADSHVYDLTLRNPTIGGAQNLGVLAGTLAGTVENITLQGGYINNSGTGFTGGLCGIAESTAVITNCVAESGIFIAGNAVGGLAGKNESAAWTNCFFLGSVYGYGAGYVSGGIFAKQVVGSGYTPAVNVYWKADNADQSTAAGIVEKPDDSTITGLEGLVGIKIVPDTLTLAQGSTGILTVETIPANTPISGIWALDDTSIASINQQGMVTAIGRGSIMGRFSMPYLQGKTADFTFTVNIQPA